MFKWFAKPDAFSPIECARRGWTNFSKDTLKCVTCSNINYLYSKSVNSCNFKIFQNLIKYILNCNIFSTATEETSNNDPNILVVKHNQNCPWRTLAVSSKILI